MTAARMAQARSPGRNKVPEDEVFNPSRTELRQLFSVYVVRCAMCLTTVPAGPTLGQRINCLEQQHGMAYTLNNFLNCHCTEV